MGKVLKQRLKAATKKGRLKPEANIETLVASQWLQPEQSVLLLEASGAVGVYQNRHKIKKKDTKHQPKKKEYVALWSP